MRMIVIVILVFVACSVPPLSLDGKQCPCAPGYTCDQLTNICLASDGDGGIIDSRLAEQCLGAGTGAELYRYTGNFAATWASEDTTWMGTAQITQSDKGKQDSFAFPTGSIPNDYRVISTLKQTTGGPGTPSLGIVLRAQLTLGEQQRYACSWTPKNGELRIQVYSSGGSATTLISALVDGASETAQVTMEARVVTEATVPKLSCCLREHTGARLMDFAHTTGAVTTGVPGLQTDRMAAAFGTFVVLGP